MYCKLFASLYQGTLRGRANEILVFTNLLAHCDREGYVDKHFRAIAEETGLSLDAVRSAILNLEAPDEESRSPEHSGARLVRMDQHRAWGWRVVNYVKYRTIRDEEDRREQNRLSQSRFRAKHSSQPAATTDADSNQSKPPSASVISGKQDKPESAHVEVDVEVDVKELPITIPFEPAAPRPAPGKAENPSAPKPKPERPPPSSHHTAFIDGWMEAYKSAHGYDYGFKAGRDGLAVKNLLKFNILPIDLLEIAKAAWARAKSDPYCKACKMASEIHSFYHSFNAIRQEASTTPPQPTKPTRPHPNDFIIPPGTTRAPRPTEEQKLAARAARIAEQQRLSAAQNQVPTEPPPNPQ